MPPLLRAACVLLASAAVCGAASPAMETLDIRGQPQKVRIYGAPGGPAAVVASGDGGWIHLGPRVAEMLSARGWLVVGVDVKEYLSSFTHGKETLRPEDVPGDFGLLVARAARGASGPPALLGVSEGAALAVLAATDEAVKGRVRGVVALGLPQRAELGWRFRDSMIYVTKGVPNEPTFDTSTVVGRVAPLPLVAIHSTHDEFVPVDEIRRVMDRAGEPKQLRVLPAADHRFSDNEGALEEALFEALAWLGTARR